MRNTHSSKNGQALIEFALVLPLLFLLIVNVVNYGGLIYAWIVVAHASRSAAQYTVTGPAYLGYGTPHYQGSSLTQIKALLTTCPGSDMCSLPNLQTNQPNPMVRICVNSDRTGTSPTYVPPGDSQAVCTAVPTIPATFVEPEKATSVIATVDVTYHYCPLIPFWEFPALGIHSTLPTCTGLGGGMNIHRTAAMRMIQ